MQFSSWLGQQERRNDPIGDLARDTRTDSEFPRDGDYQTQATHLRLRGACAEALDALREAWREFGV